MMLGWKKAIMITGLVLVVAIAASAGYAYWLLRSSLPVYSGEITVPGLTGEATVFRDHRGVAYIYASEPHDLYFAQGYVHAQERLWQMEVYRRALSGRLSEVIGESTLEMDTFARRLGLREIGEEILQITSPETRKVLQSYVDGVNAFLATASLPPEFRLLGYQPEPWTIEDTIGSIVLIAYEVGTNWKEEATRATLQEGVAPDLFAEILPPYENETKFPVWRSDQAPAITPDQLSAMLDNTEIDPAGLLPRLGSNSWVIGPELSATGSAMLANDPHVSLSLPSIWFENHLEVPGEIFLYGWSIPGAPSLIIGHNRYISWGTTNIGDAMDLFFEKQHPHNPHLFLMDEKWYEAEVSHEEIIVKGKEEPVEIEVVITQNGPLIFNDPPIALRWSAYDLQGSSADAYYGINMARNWDEFRKASLNLTIPMHCIVFADTEGNIGFRMVGQVPIRKQGRGVMPAPGWDSAYAWDGFVPMEELPELYNPPAGFVATANYQVAGADYPHSIAIDNAPPYRMKRIVEVLQTKEQFTVQDFKDLQNDWYNRHAAERLPKWLMVLEQNIAQMDKTGQEALTLLKEWANHPVNNPAEPGPAIFQVWYLNLMKDVFAPEMGEELYQKFLENAYLAYNALENLLNKDESAWFANGLEPLLIKSYNRTIQELSRDQGHTPAKWEWQKLQTVTLEHVMGRVALLRPLFNRGPYPYGGDHMTVGRAAYRLTQPFDVVFGVGLRYISLMTPEIETWGVNAGGQSGHPLSKHYDDQVPTWLDGKYYQLKLSKEDLIAQNAPRLILRSTE